MSINAMGEYDGTIVCTQTCDDLSVFRELIEAGANVNDMNNGKTVLVNVLERGGSAEIVRFVIDSGARVEGAQPPPLYYDTKYHHDPDVLVVLLEADASTKERYENGMTPLLLAARSGSVAFIETLLDAGSDIRERDENGFTDLMHESAENTADVVRMILAEGVVVNESYGHSSSK